MPPRHLQLRALKYIFERSIKVCVGGVRPIGIGRPVAPMFVHPEPGRRIFSHIRFKRVPTCLCDLLMTHVSGALDLRMENETITSIGQRFAMCWDNRGTGLLMQPCMRRSHTCL